MIDKRLGTNIAALGCVLIGWALNEPFHTPILNMGMFAVSGAVTNWIAIYMLFEKVPGLYGSGVVPLHFEDFKVGIRNLIMGQFFTKEQVEQFLISSSQDEASPDMGELLKDVDLDPAFNSLIEVIQESAFGPMLNMVGGIEALEPMREPFAEKMKVSLQEISHAESFQHAIKAHFSGSSESEHLLEKVEDIVQKRLDELTPQMVKNIVEQMIEAHLGWLVVWGGVFGGLIGLFASMF